MKHNSKAFMIIIELLCFLKTIALVSVRFEGAAVPPSSLRPPYRFSARSFYYYIALRKLLGDIFCQQRGPNIQLVIRRDRKLFFVGSNYIVWPIGM